MKKYRFSLEVDAPEGADADTVGRILNELINVGLADASDTVEEGIENEEAELAVKLEIGPPEEVS